MCRLGYFPSVSIPNGMEFYTIGTIYLGGADSFNSQRDGILLVSDVVGELVLLLFQFPTGWNSTLIQKFRFGLKASFNSQRDGILRSITRAIKRKSSGFNSQRDGILPKEFQTDSSLSLAFQFPTGWNSTFAPSSISLSSEECFNSQRDGILRLSRCYKNMK